MVKYYEEKKAKKTKNENSFATKIKWSYETEKGQIQNDKS